MRSVQIEASAHSQWRLGALASAPCLALSGTPGAVFASLPLIALPSSCPAFPRTGFAAPSSRGLSPQRYYAGSDSCRDRTPPTGLSAYPALPSGHSVPPTTCAPKIAFAVTSASPARPVAKSRLRQAIAGSPTQTAETGSLSYGLSFRLRLLSTPPRSDAVAFGFMLCDFT